MYVHSIVSRGIRALAGWVGPMVAVAPAVLSNPSNAADWPMWRHDPLRSGAATEDLPQALHIRWVRELPRPQMAWPNEPRLDFDRGYEPVIAGKRLFIASPADGSIRAYDVDSGRQLWRFYTDAPARFASVVWKDRVFAVSDDGFLYALDAATGRLLWRVSGSDRPQRWLLGNNRLISLRLARGGPVTTDGVVYFAAGIWPTHGVYIHAVDAATGKPVWTNSDCYWLPNTRIDHNGLANAGLSPQGYLVCVRDRLLIPNGRALPAVLDRGTGKLLSYLQGYRNGHCRVVASSNYAFVGPTGVVSIADGREVGSKWKAAGPKAPRVGFKWDTRDLCESPAYRYKFTRGCSAWSVVTSGRAYGLEDGVFYAHDLIHARISEYKVKIGGLELDPKKRKKAYLTPWRWDPPCLWEYKTPLAGRGLKTHALILAGSRLYGNAGRTLLALQLPGSRGMRPKLAWTLSLESEPVALAAADGKLFVATVDGKIICLAGEAPAAVQRFPRERAPLPAPSASVAATADRILKVSGVTSGFAVLLGPRNPQDLIAALLARSRLRIIAVLPDAKRVTALRDRLVRAGVYGTRVELIPGDPAAVRLPPYLASLLVAEFADSRDAAWRAADIFRVLRPYGGVALLRADPAAHRTLVAAVHAGKLENAQVRRQAPWSILRRPGPLPGAADWTHECADAARTFYSKDDRVRAPLGILWFGDGPDYGFYKFHDYATGVKPQVVAGRLFALRQLAPTTLRAVDAYTGRLLWEKRVGRWSRYASMPDAVYVADGDRLLALDPETGNERMEVHLDTRRAGTGAPIARDIRVSGETVVVAIGFGSLPGQPSAKDVRWRRSHDIWTRVGPVNLIQSFGLWNSRMLVAVDRKSGRVLWRREAEKRFNNNALAMGDGAVFCTDSPSSVEIDRRARRGAALPKTVDSTVLALDARTGAIKWRQTVTSAYEDYPADNWGSFAGIRDRDDWLGYSHENGVLLAGRADNICGLNAKTGKKLWARRAGRDAKQPVIIRAKTFITQTGAVFDIRTGRRVGWIPLRRGGCNYAVAGVHLALARAEFVSYTDLDHATFDLYLLRNIRAGCSNNLIAADGILSAPCFSTGCTCNYPLQASFAMVTMPEAAPWAHPRPLKPRRKPAVQKQKEVEKK